MLVVSAGAALGLLAWRLSAGPLSLAWAIPAVERAFEPTDGSLDVAIDDIELTWREGAQPLRLRVVGVHARGRDGTPIFDLREVAVGVSAEGLLRGRLQPTHIDIERPRLALVRTDEGLTLAGGGDSGPGEGDALRLLLPELLAVRRDGDGPFDRLESIGIIEARVTIDDQVMNRRWSAARADFRLARAAGGLHATATVDVELSGNRARINGEAAIAADLSRIDALIDIPRLPVATLAASDPALAALAAVEAEIGGTVAIALTREGIRELRADLFTGAGRITLAALPAPVAFAGLRLRAASGGAFDQFTFEGAAIDLEGPTIALSGRAERIGDGLAVDVASEIRDVVPAHFQRLWPLGVSRGGRRWVTQNISGGRIDDARFEVSFLTPGLSLDGLELTRLDGRFRFSGATVDYRNPMPVAREVSGTAVLTPQSLTLDVDHAVHAGVTIDAARIVIRDLDQLVEVADIDIRARGPVRDVLDIANSEPLRFVTRINRDPRDFGGNASVRLILRFPLAANLTLDDIDAAAGADITGFQMRRATRDLDVRGGAATLRVDTRGYEMTGRVTLGTAPADVALTRNFDATAPFAQRVTLRGRIGNAELQALRLDWRPWIDGPVQIELVHTEFRGGREDLAVDFGLQDARIAIPEIDWSKPAGRPATGHIELSIVNDRVTELRNFRVQADGFEARGAGSFTPDGRGLRQLRVENVAFANTQVRGTVTFEAGGIAVEMTGPSLDLTPLLRARNNSQTAAMPTVQIAAEIDRVIVGRERVLERVRFQGRRAGARWIAINFDSGARDEAGLAAIRLRLTTEGGRQRLRADAVDGGGLLALFGVADNVRGGRVIITGESNSADGPITGRIEMRDFRVANAPVLAHIISSILLAGIGDALSGEGLRFTSLVGGYTYQANRITLREWHAFGVSTGITAAGTIDLGAHRLDLSGMVVPGNALNGLLNNVPVLGELLGGRGGGLLAANYRVRGSLADPQVNIDVLSILALGQLRNLIRGSDQGATAPPQQAQEPDVPPTSR